MKYKFYYFILVFTCLFAEINAQNHLNVSAGYLVPAKFSLGSNSSVIYKTSGGFEAGIHCEHEFVLGRFGLVMSSRLRVGLGLNLIQQNLRFSSSAVSAFPNCILTESDEHSVQFRELQIPLKFRFYIQKYTYHAWYISAGAALRIPLTAKAFIAHHSSGAEQSGQNLPSIKNGQFAFPFGVGFTKILPNTQLIFELSYRILPGYYQYTGDKNHGWASDQQVRIPSCVSFNIGLCLL